MSSLSKPGRTRIRYAVLLSAIVLLVIAVMTALTIKSNAVDAKLAAIRLAGEPVSIAELEDRIPDVTDSANAALIYLDAAETFQSKESQLERNTTDVDTVDRDSNTSTSPLYSFILIILPKPLDEGGERQPIPESSLDRLERYLAAHSETLALLDEADAQKFARYPKFHATSVQKSLHRLGALGELAFLRMLQCVNHSEHGNTEQAIAALLGALRIAQSLEHEPSTFAYMRRCRIVGTSVRQLELLLSRGGVSLDQLGRFCETLADIKMNDTFRLALMGDRASFIAWRGIMTAPKPTRLLKAVEDDYYLGYLNNLVRIAKLPPYETQEAGLTVQARFTSDLLPFLHRITHANTSHFTRAIELRTESLAYCDLAILVCAVERFRSDKGEIPASLEGLSPEYTDRLPMDPFSGESYIFWATDEEYVLYSVGRNGIADGGSTKHIAGPDYGLHPADITFRVYR